MSEDAESLLQALTSFPALLLIVVFLIRLFLSCWETRETTWSSTVVSVFPLPAKHQVQD